MSKSKKSSRLLVSQYNGTTCSANVNGNMICMKNKICSWHGMVCNHQKCSIFKETKWCSVHQEDWNDLGTFKPNYKQIHIAVHYKRWSILEPYSKPFHLSPIVDLTWTVNQLKKYISTFYLHMDVKSYNIGYGNKWVNEDDPQALNDMGVCREDTMSLYIGPLVGHLS